MKRETVDVFLIGGLIFAICLFFVVFILAAPNIAEKERADHYCPYGDTDGLGRYGGIVTYSVGSEEMSFAVVKGYHSVNYYKGTLTISHTERIPVGTWNHVSYVYKPITDLTINGWQIVNIEVKK